MRKLNAYYMFTRGLYWLYLIRFAEWLDNYVEVGARKFDVVAKEWIRLKQEEIDQKNMDESLSPFTDALTKIVEKEEDKRP